MGCGKKAVYEDEQDLESAILKVGLKNDKIWGNPSLYSTEADTIEKCAKEGCNKYTTILKLHLALAAEKATRKANKEIEERKKLEELKSQY